REAGEAEILRQVRGLQTRPAIIEHGRIEEDLPGMSVLDRIHPHGLGDAEPQVTEADAEGQIVAVPEGTFRLVDDRLPLVPAEVLDGGRQRLVSLSVG